MCELRCLQESQHIFLHIVIDQHNKIPRICTISSSDENAEIGQNSTEEQVRPMEARNQEQIDSIPIFGKIHVSSVRHFPLSTGALFSHL